MGSKRREQPPIQGTDVGERIAASRTELGELHLRLQALRRKTHEIAQRLRELEARRTGGR